MPQRDWDSPLYGKHGGEVLTSSGAIDVIACDACGFSHIVPLPAPETQESFYKDSFYQEEKANYLHEADEDFAWKRVECQLRYAVAADIMGCQTGRVLDIGCGPGDFLAVGKELGWDGLGIEPSPVAARHARSRGLEVLEGFFSADTASQLGTFDFIHLSEVLEHVAEPGNLLKLAETLLKPGGTMCISTPNDFNPLQKVVVAAFDKPSWWVVPDHHLNYFDFDSLSHLMVAAGLSVERKLSNFPMELFLLMGQDYTLDPDKGRSLHKWRKNLDINLAKTDRNLMLTLYQSLAEANIGRLAILFAVKPEIAG